MKTITATAKQLTTAFTKWEHEFRTNPAAFEARSESVKRSARSHGGRLTNTLLGYLPKGTVK